MSTADWCVLQAIELSYGLYNLLLLLILSFYGTKCRAVLIIALPNVPFQTRCRPYLIILL